ncbi:hypothetical protein ABGB18_21160 [Nonomuraea sp. B12E4]|uniref:hypothetical protein n=1 Tax=Nonomuraea sp. B12E4 TaxID=3153564 RepID=UPI00325DEA29
MDTSTVAVSANLPVIPWDRRGPGRRRPSWRSGLGWGSRWRSPVGSIREPSDFAGLPAVRDGGTRFAPPRWAKRLAAAGSGSCSWTSRRPRRPRGQPVARGRAAREIRRRRAGGGARPYATAGITADQAGILRVPSGPDG